VLGICGTEGRCATNTQHSASTVLSVLDEATDRNRCDMAVGGRVLVEAEPDRDEGRTPEVRDQVTSPPVVRQRSSDRTGAARNLSMASLVGNSVTSGPENSCTSE
jgi:hypothetical protein